MMSRTKMELSRMAEKSEVPRFVRDILGRVPGFAFRAILDIGANTGQSCIPLPTHSRAL